MKQILVSGSSAYDNIHHYDGEFTTLSIQELANISLLSSHYTKNHGGTGANIAYNLALLWESAILLTSVGDDYDFSDLIREKINLSYVHRQEMVHSAHSVIIADSKDNRMTFFQSWAMDYASHSKFEYVREQCSIWIVSANHIPTMIEHAQSLSKKNITCIIDPSQQISQMNTEQLTEFLNYGDILIANEYEFQQILEKTQSSESELVKKYETLIVTLWYKGLKLYKNWISTHINAVHVEDFDDTTWAWDALRAGILYWLTEWHDIETACKLGTVLASYSILSSGSQQHHFWLWNVMEDMKTHFDIDIDLFSKRKY